MADKNTAVSPEVVSEAISAAASAHLKKMKANHLYDTKVVEVNEAGTGVVGVLHSETDLIAKSEADARNKTLLAAGKKIADLEDKEYQVHVTRTFCYGMGK